MNKITVVTVLASLSLIVVFILCGLGILGGWGWIIRAAIDAFLVVALVIVTWRYVHLTHDLVKIEKKRDEVKREQFLNVLLAEFRMNESFMTDLINELQENKLSDWFAFKSVFLGFTEKGFDAFRNQGGFQYLENLKCGDGSLYDEIAEYYVSQYKIHKKIEKMIDLSPGEDRLKSFIDEICEQIKKLKKTNVNLQGEISNRKKY